MSYYSPYSVFSPSTASSIYYPRSRPPPVTRPHRKAESYVSYLLNGSPTASAMAWYGNGQGVGMQGGGVYGGMPGSAPPGSSYYSFPSSAGMMHGAPGSVYQQHSNPALANGYTSGQAYSQLGYDYRLPSLNWSPDSSWGGYEWANAQFRYGGPGAGGRAGVRGSQFGVMDRNWYDGIVDSLSSFFNTRRMRQSEALQAHRRIYYNNEIGQNGIEQLASRDLGGAAAFQSFLIWDQNHFSMLHQYPTEENLNKLVSMAVGEVYALFHRMGLHEHQNSLSGDHAVRLNEAAETAAATAKYLFEHHYHSSGHGVSRRGSMVGGATPRRRHRSGSLSEARYDGGVSREQRAMEREQREREREMARAAKMEEEERYRRGQGFGQYPPRSAPPYATGMEFGTTMPYGGMQQPGMHMPHGGMYPPGQQQAMPYGPGGMPGHWGHYGGGVPMTGGLHGMHPGLGGGYGGYGGYPPY